MIFCYVEKVKISGCICFTIEYLSNSTFPPVELANTLDNSSKII